MKFVSDMVFSKTISILSKIRRTPQEFTFEILPEIAKKNCKMNNSIEIIVKIILYFLTKLNIIWVISWEYALHIISVEIRFFSFYLELCNLR